MVDRDDVTELREDVSRFVVHLTRNDRADFPTGGGTARENFLSILGQKTILATRAHCLHGKKIKTLTKVQQEHFKVACFTEVPLNQIRFLVRKIAGRNIQLAPYGFVFHKEYLIRQGAQPAIYINNYDGNDELREAVDTIWEKASESNFAGKIWKLLPFINIMHSGYDFTWEREWRMRGDLSFALKRLVCAILPDNDKDDDIRERLSDAGIAAISPEWTYERMVAELANQQRKTTVKLKGLAK